MKPILALCALLLCLTAHAAQPIQFCPIAANQFAVPVNPADSLRTLDPATNQQSCITYSALTATLKVRGGTPADWHTPAELAVPLYSASSPPLPPPAPPASCPDTIAVVNYTCSITNKTITCTAPIP